jgi:hypothetical protein
MRISVGVVLLFTLVFFQNCAQSEMGGMGEKGLDESTNEHLLPVLKNDLEQSIDLTCSDASDCQSIAAGAKACGGPTRYYIFSSRTTDATKVQALADQITQIEMQANRESNLNSDCMYMLPPTLDCVQSQCAQVAE